MGDAGKILLYCMQVNTLILKISVITAIEKLTVCLDVINHAMARFMQELI